ncbi:uncharacterized protein LOC135947770 [Cloeon dipterum]|uniref:uncharacterized protein LOC135947770 n=1 Tax=Cloeon dipterum TaxID=197152 RepID=UPI003220974A
MIPWAGNRRWSSSTATPPSSVESHSRGPCEHPPNVCGAGWHAHIPPATAPFLAKWRRAHEQLAGPPGAPSGPRRYWWPPAASRPKYSSTESMATSSSSSMSNCPALTRRAAPPQPPLAEFRRSDSLSSHSSGRLWRRPEEGRERPVPAPRPALQQTAHFGQVARASLRNLGQ